MNPILELLALVDPQRPLLEQMVEGLRAEAEWRCGAVELVESLGDDELVALNHQATPPDVDPRLLAVAEREGVGVVRINLFSREAFLRFWRAGSLSPHYHRRSFTTRLLNGSYHHLRFDNDGTLDAPKLTPHTQEFLKEGDGYALDWREYHFVMLPASATCTLTVHTPPAIPPRGEFPRQTRDEVLRLRADVLASLTATGGTST